jgi:hypothetical protein
MASINCPKCQKAFTHPKYPSKAKEHLEAHLKRKNACDGSTGPFKFERKKTRDSVPSIDELDLTGLVEALEGNIRFKFVASFVFKVLNDRNCFAVWPNTKMYEIYFMDEDVPRYATPATFMLEFWNRVMVKQVKPLLKERWSRYHEYAQSLTVNSSRGFNAYVANEVAMINSFMRSEFYTTMKSAIMGHLKTVPRNERFQTRVNMGVEVPESRSIMYVAPEKCCLKNCERPQSLYGVCEFHRELWLKTYPQPPTPSHQPQETCPVPAASP